MTSVSIVIPARDEGETVADVVRCAREGVPTADVVVVDDGSSDDTDAAAQDAGARVIASLGSGKGAALWTGVRETYGEVVLFLDGDVTNPRPETAAALVDALTADSSLVMVRAAYERPYGSRPGEGGRVTELTARPALTLFPTLAHLRQPLAGEVATRRNVIESVGFVDGYGVDVGLLLDIAARHGADAIGEVSIASRAHRNRPLHQLTPMAVEVLRVILDRAGVATIGPRPHERPPLATERSFLDRDPL